MREKGLGPCLSLQGGHQGGCGGAGGPDPPRVPGQPSEAGSLLAAGDRLLGAASPPPSRASCLWQAPASLAGLRPGPPGLPRQGSGRHGGHSLSCLCCSLCPAGWPVFPRLFTECPASLATSGGAGHGDWCWLVVPRACGPRASGCPSSQGGSSAPAGCGMHLDDQKIKPYRTMSLTCPVRGLALRIWLSPLPGGSCHP